MNTPQSDCMIEFSVMPLGADESMTSEVAECMQVIRESGLDYELHAMGTIVEGPLEELLKLVEQCMRRVSQGDRRVTCSAKLDLRPGHTGRIKAKVASVEAKLKSEG